VATAKVTLGPKEVVVVNAAVHLPGEALDHWWGLVVSIESGASWSATCISKGRRMARAARGSTAS
jgi:hypothetical protein